MGCGYASFLPGLVDNGFTGVPTKTRVGSHSFSYFVQDSWKVTRTLTLDYGLRYDFGTYLQSQYGLLANFGPSTPNPSAGGRQGATVFDSYLPGRCQCHLASNYPFAYGPRIGLAYQINSKAVLRTGAGVSYYKTDDNNSLSFSTGSQNRYSAPSCGYPAFVMAQGMPYKVTWPNFDPGQLPLPGTVSAPLLAIDREARAHAFLEFRFETRNREKSGGRSVVCRQPQRLVNRLGDDSAESEHRCFTGRRRIRSE